MTLRASHVVIWRLFVKFAARTCCGERESMMIHHDHRGMKSTDMFRKPNAKSMGKRDKAREKMFQSTVLNAS